MRFSEQVRNIWKVGVLNYLFDFSFRNLIIMCKYYSNYYIQTGERLNQLLKNVTDLNQKHVTQFGIPSDKLSSINSKQQIWKMTSGYVKIKSNIEIIGSKLREVKSASGHLTKLRNTRQDTGLEIQHCAFLATLSPFLYQLFRTGRK